MIRSDSPLEYMLAVSIVLMPMSQAALRMGSALMKYQLVVGEKVDTATGTDFFLWQDPRLRYAESVIALVRCRRAQKLTAHLGLPNDIPPRIGTDTRRPDLPN